MPTPSEVREIAYERGLAKKRKNAIVALLSGALPGVVLSFYLLVSWERWLIGLVIGLNTPTTAGCCTGKRVHSPEDTCNITAPLAPLRKRNT